MAKKVLVIGATGAMGRYLVPELAKGDFIIDALSLDEAKSEFPNVTYYKVNAKDPAIRADYLAKHYDAIVDFMVYSTAETEAVVPLMTQATGQYFYVSSCRVFDDKEVPIRESSPRLIDSSEDKALLASDDYCIHKARGENILRALPTKNWTIVRPSTTYSYLRYQLVTWEAPDCVGRAFAGKAVVLPVQAYAIPASLCWGCDVGKMIAALVGNDRALGEDFNVTTNESHTWSEIADYYKDICGLKAIWVDKEDYLDIRAQWPGSRQACRWQLEYARLFRRVYDNSKLLDVTGLKQEQFISLYDGLKHEIDRTPRDYPFPNNQLMDDYLKKLLP